MQPTTNYGLGSVKVRTEVLMKEFPSLVLLMFIGCRLSICTAVHMSLLCHFPQAELNLHKLTRSSYWKYEQVRLNFWQSCDTTFQREGVEPEQAAQFFEVSEFESFYGAFFPCTTCMCAFLALSLCGKTPLIKISRLLQSNLHGFYQPSSHTKATVVILRNLLGKCQSKVTCM